MTFKQIEPLLKQGRIFYDEQWKDGTLYIFERDGKIYYQLTKEKEHQFPDHFKSETRDSYKECFLDKVENQVKNTKSTHYNLWEDYETIDLIKNTLTKEEYIGALKFNILKYRLRNKGQDEADNEKVADYQRELNQILKEMK